MKNKLVKLSGAAKFVDMSSFESPILFQDEQFSVNQQQQWALIGASGSGKTTLLKHVLSKFHVSSGERQYPLQITQVSARHHFRNLSNTKDFYYQQRFNSSDSEDSETVSDYLKGIQSYKEHGFWDYDRLIKRLNLLHLLDKQLIKLSNGETKRLRIAAALSKNPDLLLLDNPLTGLDVASRADFDQLLSEIVASGIHILLATSPLEIPEVITHIAVMEDGKVVKTMEKEAFEAKDFDFAAVKDIDGEELQALLAMQQHKPYQQIIAMENVHIQYGDKVILDQVNWTVTPGERWALLGHNGAGKSTLLSLINGDNPQAYANNIILFDRKRGSGESIWDIKKKIGFVSPEFFQYFETGTSCLQVLESGFYDTLGLFRPSDPAKAAICKRWMDLLEIGTYANKLFKNVPVSIQRLCLLARALVKNPPLLIFDEPCQGLDAHQQGHFKRVVDAICGASQVTLIYVSHYQHEIPDSVTKTLKLEQGRVVQAS